MSYFASSSSYSNTFLVLAFTISEKKVFVCILFYPTLAESPRILYDDNCSSTELTTAFKIKFNINSELHFPVLRFLLSLTSSDKQTSNQRKNPLVVVL